jgi:hypothetical protein
LFPRDPHELRHDKSCGGKHGSTSMLELRLTEPWDPLRRTLHRQ